MRLQLRLGSSAQLLLKLADQMRARAEVSGDPQRHGHRSDRQRGRSGDPSSQAHD
jgi:hypothetical protein